MGEGCRRPDEGRQGKSFFHEQRARGKKPKTIHDQVPPCIPGSSPITSLQTKRSWRNRPYSSAPAPCRNPRAKICRISSMCFGKIDLPACANLELLNAG